MKRLVTLLTVLFAVVFALGATASFAAPVGDPNPAGTAMDTAIKDNATAPSAGETNTAEPAKEAAPATKTSHKKSHKKSSSGKSHKKSHKKKGSSSSDSSSEGK